MFFELLCLNCCNESVAFIQHSASSTHFSLIQNGQRKMIVALCKMVEGWGSEIRRSLLHGEGRAGAGPGPGEPLGGSTGCEGGSSGRASAGARRRERERERDYNSQY